jgi:formate dehydrogenase major subunit
VSRKRTGESCAPAETRITPAYRPQQVEKAAPCQGGCANCGDIRGWIATVAQRDKTGLSRSEAYARAWRIITEVNPFPATLGRICPHPCEDHCNRGDFDQPLAINAMERFLGDLAIRSGQPLAHREKTRRAQSIGVVGAGPSGLSFAYQMARRGYPVTVYDVREKPGGMLRYGVPDYRLPQAVLDAEIRKIVDLGVDLALNTRVGRDIALEELRARHDCVYLGIGAQDGRALDIPGAVGRDVWTGTNYLSRINCGERPEVGESVVVIGGGNTAVDSARCARRSGADVSILYRRSRSEMPAVEREIEDALEEGVQLVELVAPLAVRRQADGRVAAVMVQRMRLGERDASGRRRPVAVAGSEFEIKADTVISAIAQVPVLDGFEALDQEGGWLVTDEQGAVADGVLAGGDALGPGIAGKAILQGRRAAERLHARLAGAGESAQKLPERPAIGAERVRLATKPAAAAVHSPVLTPEQRLQPEMPEVGATISEAQFLAEVERCFSCGLCFGCEQCYMYCTAGCFTRLEEPRPGLYFSLSLDACQECGKCVEVCPCGYLEAAQDRL